MEDGGRIKLVPDVPLSAGDRVLLEKYKETRKYDHQTGWFLSDDYLRRLEHPEDAALRILAIRAPRRTGVLWVITPPSY